MKISHVLKVRLLCTLQHEFYEHQGVGDNGLLPRFQAENHYVYVYWAGSVSEISPLFSS